MKKGQAPPYKTGQVIWECWITSDGQRFVWRGAGDRLLAGKHSGAHEYWAKVDGAYLPKSYPDLKAAMSAAFRAMAMNRMRKAG